jgi:hypothetical protein
MTAVEGAMRRLIVLALACAGCGDGSGGGTSQTDGGAADGGAVAAALPGDAVDCAWLQSDAFCWNDAMRRMDDCTPDSVVSDDPHQQMNVARIDDARTACTYPDGTTVQFRDGAVPADVYGPDGLEVFGDYHFDVEVHRPDGSLCFAYDEDAKPFEVRFPDAVYRRALVGGTDPSQYAFVFTCPDGSTKHIAVSDALHCDQNEFAGFSTAGSFLFLVAQRGLDRDTKRTIVACDGEFQ